MAGPTRGGEPGRLAGRPRSVRARRLAAPAILAALALLAAACASPTATPGDGSAGSGPEASPSGAAPSMAAPSAEAMADPVAQTLQVLLDDWVAAGNGTGVTAAVVSPAGLWSGAAGVDGAGGPVAPESAMSIADITKTFTAAEVMLLAGRRLVDLDRPISDYLTLPFDPRGATVRQVLGMRAGFPADPLVTEGVWADLGRAWTTDEVLGLVGPNPARMGQLGGTPTYNDVNYYALGALIEELTGGSYASAIRGDLIEPAGLARVWVQDAETPEPPLAVGEASLVLDVVDPNGPYLPSRAVASASGAAGSIAADAASLARWGYLLYGGLLIDPGLVEQMTTTDDGQGLGTFTGDVDGVPIVGHGGDDNAYYGALLVFPESETSVAVLVPNVSGAHVGTGDDAVSLAAQLEAGAAGHG